MGLTLGKTVLERVLLLRIDPEAQEELGGGGLSEFPWYSTRIEPAQRFLPQILIVLVIVVMTEVYQRRALSIPAAAFAGPFERASVAYFYTRGSCEDERNT